MMPIIKRYFTSIFSVVNIMTKYTWIYYDLEPSGVVLYNKQTKYQTEIKDFVEN